MAAYNELARERAQDKADTLEDFLAGVERVAPALKCALYDLRRHGTESDILPLRLRVRREAARLRSLAEELERPFGQPVAVDIDPDDPLPLRTVEHA